MRIGQYFKSAVVISTALSVSVWAAASQTCLARGGGGHGEGEHGGEHHEEHHEAHHEEHHSERHAEHHEDHRAEHHHDDHHWNHHHHDWHYSNWGWAPGFWGGGAALGYGLGDWSGWSPAYGPGDTYVDNSNSGNVVEQAGPLTDSVNSNDDVINESDPASQNEDAGQQAGVDGKDTASGAGNPSKLPVDFWPELGVSTFTGHKGDESGLVVVRVKPRSIAQKAGLVPGDVILKFNGQPTSSDEAMESLLESARGKFEMSVVDANSGESRTLTGELSPAENSQNSGRAE